MNDLYISMTTIPSRMNKLVDILGCYLKLNLLPKKIFICIPYKSDRFKIDYIIPDNLLKFVEQNNIFKIIRCDDFGPATKLLGCLNEVPDNSNILVCDDDRKPHINFSKLFQDKSNDNKNTIITGLYRAQPGNKIKLPWGSCGILFPKNLINNDIYKYFELLCPECKYVDDVFWYKYFIQLKKYKIIEATGARPSSEINGDDALYKEKGTLNRNIIQNKCFNKPLE